MVRLGVELSYLDQIEKLEAENARLLAALVLGKEFIECQTTENANKFECALIEVLGTNEQGASEAAYRIERLEAALKEISEVQPQSWTTDRARNALEQEGQDV